MALVFGLLLALLGGLAWWLMRRKADAIEAEIEAARTWPTTEGVITRSRVIRAKQSGGLYPSVHFSYELGGKTYHSGRMLFGGFTGGADEAEAFVAARPKGARVKVYYDPSNPKSAVLVPQGDARTWRANAVWLAATFVIGGVLVAVIARP